MVKPKVTSILDFEELALRAQSPAEMEFYLKNSLHINIPYIEYREYLVYYKGDIGEFLSRKWNESPFLLDVVNPRLPAYHLKHVAENDDEQIEGIIVVLAGSTDSLFRIISVSDSKFWKSVVKPFLRKTYPHISIVYFKQDEVEKVLLDFEEMLNRQYLDKARIRVIELTRKSERSSRVNKGYISTERSWTSLSLKETFADLKERGFWFTSIKFRVIVNIPKRGNYFQRSTGKISRFGSFFCTGMYEEYRSYLMEPLENLVAERMRLLEGRGIVERDYRPGPPLEIIFEDDVFDSTPKIREFGEILSHYNDASIVVYHGNPYFHANIADQRDGSSFEIWVLSQKRILISPQATTSAHALSRVISYIFDRFKEGAVREYVPRAE